MESSKKSKVIVRRKGEILENLGESKKVNCLREEILDIELYVANDKLYKPLKNGKFRELVKQDSRPEYNHYFLRDKDKKKLTLNAHKLDLLMWTEPKIELKSEEETIKDTVEETSE
ncbi:hypothetical protein FACS189472_13270 [Alphaproteobacteria bacterium]|nr:hypothetical protein FACS189472_13270 [Alphaproteobacteria bacterium]